MAIGGKPSLTIALQSVSSRARERAKCRAASCLSLHRLLASPTTPPLDLLRDPTTSKPAAVDRNLDETVEELSQSPALVVSDTRIRQSGVSSRRRKK